MDYASKIADARRGTVKPEPVKKAEPIKKATVYLPESVWEVLRDLAHSERISQHDLIKEGLTMMFHDRGLPSWDEIAAGGKDARGHKRAK